MKLSKYYFFFQKMNKIFLNVFPRIFGFILFSNFVNTSNEFIYFKKFESLFEIMYNHYRWKESFFNIYSLYNHVKCVNIINVNNQKFIDIAFNDRHSFSKFRKQRSLLSLIVNYFIFLYDLLSTNKIVEDVICNKHLKTNVWQNNFDLIFLIFFVFWDQLFDKFVVYNATFSSFEKLFWRIWFEISTNLFDYVLYIVDNIRQMKKNQIKCRLNRKLRRIAKN